uniref:Uncharacterized protein LOC102809294 n=1 Tax=Saccoglossus kowalevskii TaxID=10224 RepID=A0ABM0M651_SACKO|nr:PREDICTED: uncharacterized protein LOC102809294 [Saccoglossus kowalevskii]
MKLVGVQTLVLYSVTIFTTFVATYGLTFLYEPHDVTLFEGDSLTIPCTLSSRLTNVQVYWYNNTRQISFDNLRYELNGILRYDLQITDLELSDSGNYSCLVYINGEYVATSRTGNVNVILKPYFRKIPSDVITVEGETVVLTYTLANFDANKFDIYWNRDKIKIAKNYDIFKGPRYSIEGNGNGVFDLIINTSTVEYSGQYQCACVYQSGGALITVSGKTNLKILSKPSCSQNPMSNYYMEGEYLITECRNTGDAETRLSWRNKGNAPMSVTPTSHNASYIRREWKLTSENNGDVIICVMKHPAIEEQVCMIGPITVIQVTTSRYFISIATSNPTTKLVSKHEEIVTSSSGSVYIVIYCITSLVAVVITVISVVVIWRKKSHFCKEKKHGQRRTFSYMNETTDRAENDHILLERERGVNNVEVDDERLSLNESTEPNTVTYATVGERQARTASNSDLNSARYENLPQLPNRLNDPDSQNTESNNDDGLVYAELELDDQSTSLPLQNDDKVSYAELKRC